MSLELIERYAASKVLNFVKNESKADHITKLTHLFLNDRRLHEIGELSDCKRLKVLYLHDNAIRKIENVVKLTELTHLYLQHNRIKRMENLNGLKHLRKLYLGGNEISRLENVEQLPRLEELHVDRQRFSDSEQFTFDMNSLLALAKSLRVLNITGLHLTEIDALKHCFRLETLIAEENSFESAMELGKQLTVFPCLRNVMLNDCPAQRDIRYRDKITAGALQIEILDGKEIPRNTRNFIKRFEEIKAERSKNQFVNKTSGKPIVTKPAASIRSTKSMVPTLDILMSDEAILFQSWNQQRLRRKPFVRRPSTVFWDRGIHPTSVTKKASTKTTSNKRRPTDIPLRGRVITSGKSLVSI